MSIAIPTPLFLLTTLLILINLPHLNNAVPAGASTSACASGGKTRYAGGGSCACYGTVYYCIGSSNSCNSGYSSGSISCRFNLSLTPTQLLCRCTNFSFSFFFVYYISFHSLSSSSLSSTSSSLSSLDII